jgi:hypothetical protein
MATNNGETISGVVAMVNHGGEKSNALFKP